MLSDEVSQFKTIITALFLAYPYGKPSNEQLTAWLEMFKQYQIDDIRQASHAYQANETGSPSVAGVMKYLMARPRTITAADAWEWVPKGEHISRWVTARMMSALGTAEESIQQGDMIGAKIAFAESYNAMTPDHGFFYSEAYGLLEEDKLSAKVQAYKQLKAKQWALPEQQKAIESRLTSQMNEAKRISSDLEKSLADHALTNQHQDTNSLCEKPTTGIGSNSYNREQVKRLRSTMKVMTSSNPNDTGKS